MQRRVCCYRWLVQARSPELHRNKSLTVFSWDVVRWGGCLGFQRGAVWCEFRALTAWGKKLLSSLAERALMLRYRLPEGRSWKRLREGWVGSSTILFALLEHLVRKISRMEGRGAPMIFAVPYRTVPDSDAAGQHALNGTPVEGGEDGWREGGCPWGCWWRENDCQHNGRETSGGNRTEGHRPDSWQIQYRSIGPQD